MRYLLLATAIVLALSQAASAQASRTSPFITIANSGVLSSQVLGLEVHNEKGQDIGQIEDIAINNEGQTQAYILSVGSLFGMDERYVAVDPSVVKVGYSKADQAWHASVDATLDQLKAAPPYPYSGRIGEKACINLLR